ncbi:hypothetical protein CASFOL_011442 [Castilleja foliolosa]|uniref:Uncharacterized protein n=1 Tax=Castilleja foliolosa TaxID=1961234 RepID=A0ABD3DXF4_9LAMI
MAYIHLTRNMLLFLLALTTCLGFQLAEGGRKIKSMPNPHFTSNKNPPMSSVHSPEIGHSMQNRDMQPKVQDKHLTSSNEEPTGNPPTVPGSSPGIGHKFSGQKRNMQPNVQGQHFTSHTVKLDGKNPPISLVHSPRIGHSMQKRNMQPKVQDKHLTTSTEEPSGNPPTSRGSSPGIGHKFSGQKRSMQPKVQSQHFTSRAVKLDDKNPPMSLVHSPRIGHSMQKRNMQPKVQDKHLTTSTEEPSSNPPTSRGSSPGIGHNFSGQKRNMQPKVQSQHFTLRTVKIDGKNPPMSSVHSPQVGHSIKKLNMQPKVQDKQLTSSNEKPTGNPPTTPGPSPGMGNRQKRNMQSKVKKPAGIGHSFEYLKGSKND